MLGEPVEENVVHSGYEFDSAQEIYDSLVFHIEEYADLELPQESKEQLGAAVAGYYSGNPKFIRENCTLYKFDV